MIVTDDLFGRHLAYIADGAPESIENSRLFAAAPELLESLRSATSHIHDLRIIMNAVRDMGITFHMCWETYDRTKALSAIAKATATAKEIA